MKVRNLVYAKELGLVAGILNGGSRGIDLAAAFVATEAADQE
jgi:hypothetical protein